MAIVGVPTINAPGVPVDTTRPFPYKDNVLRSAGNASVRFLADLAFPLCYPGGLPTGRPAAGNPIDGSVIYDVASRGDGSVIIPAGSLTYAGGGFDFTNAQGLTGSRNCGIAMPASVLADIWTAYSGASQQYLFTMWVKLPSLANWNNSTTLVSIAGDLSYLAGASLFIVAQKQGGLIEVRRQTSASNYDVTNVLTATPNSDQYGNVVQIAVWRNASGQGLSITGGAGAPVIVTTAAGSDNTQNFSANQFFLGRNGSSFMAGSPTAVLSCFSGMRVYRAMMENLARSGRDPLTVINSEYADVTSRAVFS